jgi:hypothetical protein
MAIQVVPYESHFAAEAKEFNRRLRDAGAYPFPLSESAPGETEPLARACGIEFHHFLAVDGSGAVRGGYSLRTQPFWIRNQIHIVGHFTAPLSEGIADKRYAGVGALLLSHALKFQPLLFAMGMGGLNNPLPRMLKSMGWVVYEVPFFFRVLNGSAFFRHLGPLHASRARSFFANTLAASGIGHVGIRMLHRARTRASFDRRFEIAPADNFEAWADEPWQQTCDRYSFSAQRDSRYLQYLYPPAGNLHPIRVNQAGSPRGWAQLMQCQPRNAAFFGGMRVMALVDGVATTAAMPSLVLAAVEQARRMKADLLFSNQMHSDWIAALRNCGFLQGPSNYLLALSKGLTGLLDPLSESARRIHFNRGDGDGRVNLTK